MRPRIWIAAVVLAVVSVTPAFAIPELQLYIQGGTYNSTTQTWEPGSTGPLVLWAIGNVSGPGSAGTISDVSLVVAYDHGLTPTIALTGGNTGGYGGFTDPSTTSDITNWYKLSTSGTEIPVLGDGVTQLPSHGDYGTNTDWQQFKIGDFNKPGDSPCGDFINTLPSPIGSGGCVIAVYTIDISGVPDGTAIHFDLFDHVVAQNQGRGMVRKSGTRYVFAPFSHDAAGATEAPIPEPATLTLFGSGMFVIAVLRRRFR